MISVLLADDHPFMRAGVEAVLRGSRYDIVETVSDGEAALEAVARRDPDICIFDIRMPKLDGVGVLEAMRSRGDERPVVILTAELTDRALYTAVKAGVNGIVLKNGAEDSLIECLDEVVSGGRAIPAELLTRALDLAMSGGTREPLAVLAPRERQIAELVAQGLRNRDIAERLGMTEGTVKVYLHGIYQKMDVENRTSLALIAREASKVS
ncbi:DNA-binding response regulator [Tsuneonella deserti]|uniref:DNA-binding response regulator n=1 Tax=Tsuneonella deserti TaxID=2035528 RepID=A0ABQ1S8B9_9SPHN|nr:response regulator transcription factor [Tsuneonella deserti]GGD95050.1 DNA-binding response regulator [Tsuneonella deserti]